MIGLGGSVSPNGLGLVADEDGSSFAAFTASGGGSWSSNGTEIEAEGNGLFTGISPMANLDIDLFGPLAVTVEVDFWLSNSNCYIGLRFFDNVSVFGTQLLIDTTTGGEMSSGGLTAPVSISTATWYTLRVESFGGAWICYVDGVEVTRFPRSHGCQVALNVVIPALVNITGNPCMFRNLRVWTADLNNL